MTNPTPHGQVPEALIDLIDAYAETRHRCGGIYNAKTEAARNAVIEALSGVQALSAAPAGWKLVPEDATKKMVRATDKVNFANADTDGTIHNVWNVMLAASPTPPAEQPDTPKAAPVDQRKAFESWARRQSWIKDCGKAPDGDAYGHWDTQKAWLAWTAALATPPAEQPDLTKLTERGAVAWAGVDAQALRDGTYHQAEESYVKLLADCRDAFPIPEPGGPLEVQWSAAMARPEEVPEYIRLCVAEMQAAPKAASAIGDELRDTLVAVSAAIAEQDDRTAQKMIREILAASPTPPAEQQAQPGAVYAELPQPDSWFHFTAQFWENKLRDFADRTHALRMQAAPKAAPTRTALPEGWTDCTIEFGNDGPEVVAYGPKRMMTRLAKWLGKYFAQVIAEAAPKAAPGAQNTVPAEWLEQAYREGWAACRDAETIGEEAEDWAFGNSTANSRMIDAQQAAPQQEAQEPVAWQGVHDQTDLYYTKPLQADVRPLYAAPQPAPAELERLRERIARMGLDVDRAMRGHVNEQSPLGTQRLAAIAALAKPAPAPLSEREAFERDWEKRHAPVPINGRTHDDGRYGDSSIQDAWERAKAAALAAQGGK